MELINLSQKLIGFMAFPLIKMNVSNSKKEKEAMCNCNRRSTIQQLNYKYTHIRDYCNNYLADFLIFFFCNFNLISYFQTNTKRVSRRVNRRREKKKEKKSFWIQDMVVHGPKKKPKTENPHTPSPTKKKNPTPSQTNKESSNTAHQQQQQCPGTSPLD